MTSCEALARVYKDKDQSADKIDRVAEDVNKIRKETTDTIRALPPLPSGNPSDNPVGWLGWLSGLGVAAWGIYLKIRGMSAAQAAEAATLHARVDARKEDLAAVEKRLRDLELGK